MTGHHATRRKWVLQPPRHCAGGELTMTHLPQATTDAVPAEAIDAAYAAARDPIRPGEMKRILGAAAPFIAARAAAAEREHIIRLATQLRAAFPADHPKGAQASFADYLRQLEQP